MSTKVASAPNLQKQLSHQKALNEITNLIHTAPSIADILLNMSEKIRKLLDCERLTIYAIDVQNQQLYSMFKVGDMPKEIRVAKTFTSIAGFCALSKKSVSIADVYDQEELTRNHPNLKFDDRWDKTTGFRSKQILAVPILFEKYLLGVLQMINKNNGLTFSSEDTKAAEEIARTLGIAFYNQNKTSRASTGKSTKFSYLIDKGILSEKDLESAISFARVNNKDIGYVLMEQNRISKEDIGKSLSEFYHCPFFFYDGSQTIPPYIKEGTNIDFWKKNLCAPLDKKPGTLIVGVVDPFDLSKIDSIKSLGMAARVDVQVALENDIIQYINASFGIKEVTSEESEFAEILTQLQTEGEKDGQALEEAEKEEKMVVEETDSAVVKLANKIVTDAYNLGVSDIHIEPMGKEDPCRIRFRRDGDCFNYQEVPSSHRMALVQRFKIMAFLDIAEKRKPQDGKIRFKLASGNIIELRVATIPTTGSGNEDIVMRILAASKPLPLDKMGMSPENLKNMIEIIQKPYGLVLCVGPTGSGKTTTLHSALGFINTEDMKIWTAEDPVEITQKGLRQVQMQSKIGLTFAAAMRSFLRADPDVVMVGEMRDEETAAIGIEASLTGHLVVSTLHTNSAPETITRLLDMGLDPFNFADALLGILAQRLARTLCKSCKEAYHPDEAEFVALINHYGRKSFPRLGIQYNPDLMLYRPKGCKECGDTGYKGRMGLHELLLGTDDIKRMIIQRKTIEEIREQAIEQGMSTLLQDGIWKVFQGSLDFKQVRAVCIK